MRIVFCVRGGSAGLVWAGFFDGVHCRPPSLVGEGIVWAGCLAPDAGTTVTMVEAEDESDDNWLVSEDAMYAGLFPYWGSAWTEWEALGDEESGGVGNRDAPSPAGRPRLAPPPPMGLSHRPSWDSREKRLLDDDDDDGACSGCELAGPPDVGRDGVSLERLADRYLVSSTDCC